MSLLLLAPLLLGQSEPKLVPDVSQREIQIRYSFTGAELLLFGAILYPRGRLPSDPADIVVVLKGPVQPIVVREKQKVGGIWMNVESERFRSAPSFYAVASSRPLSELVEERIARRWCDAGGATPVRIRPHRPDAAASALLRRPSRRRDQGGRSLPRTPIDPGAGADRRLHGRDLSHPEG
jgi:uncharacterized protein (TIGR02186 family)